MRKKTIGLALGGGGVRGLAHIPVLEKLDQMGVRPVMIAGASMGAIIGALYASGMSGRGIRKGVLRHVVARGDSLRQVFEKKNNLLKWINAISPEFGRGGLLKADRFLDYLFDEIRKQSFEDLKTPLKVIATDYWKAEEVVFDSGPLKPAINASMAVPGVFAPVAVNGRVLVDGGVVNNVPYDSLLGSCDFTIAVDVQPMREPAKHEIPGVLESVLGAFDIMIAASVKEKMKARKPDVYIRANLQGVRMLDFDKIEYVLRESAPLADELESRLLERIG